MQEHEIAQQKRQLDESIKLITDAHRRIANGEENVRVQLDSNNKLWPIAGMLNNLLARQQQLREDSSRLQSMEKDVANLIKALQQVNNQHKPVQFAQGGTIVNGVVVELFKLGALYPTSASNTRLQRSTPSS